MGTLLDSSVSTEQWAPPRYSDSPSSEVEGGGPPGRTPKGRGGKGPKGAKGTNGAGTSGGPFIDDRSTRLRSSKVKGGRPGQSSQSVNSPAKRKAGKDDDGDKSGDEKRRRKGNFLNDYRVF